MMPIANPVQQFDRLRNENGVKHTLLQSIAVQYSQHLILAAWRVDFCETLNRTIKLPFLLIRRFQNNSVNEFTKITDSVRGTSILISYELVPLTWQRSWSSLSQIPVLVHFTDTIIIVVVVVSDDVALLITIVVFCAVFYVARIIQNIYDTYW